MACGPELTHDKGLSRERTPILLAMSGRISWFGASASLPCCREGTQAPAQRLRHRLASNNSDLPADLVSFAFHSSLRTAARAASFSREAKSAYYDTGRLEEHTAVT